MKLKDKSKKNIRIKGFDVEAKVSRVLIYIFLTVLSLIVVYPFIYAFLSSFKSTREILVSSNIWPEKFDVSNYIKAWEMANFARYTFNSAWFSAVKVITSVFLSAIHGYVFARGEFRGKNIIFGVFTSLMFVCLGTSSLDPTLQILKVLRLNTTLWGLVVQGLFGLNITNVFLVRSFINSIPKELDEAATIDGCDFIQVFIKVIMPLLKPILATVGIMAFSAAWNDYLMPMVVTLSTPDARPLSVGLVALKNSSEASTAWDLILAGAMISAIPMVIVFLIFNKYFIKGLTSGAVKG